MYVSSFYERRENLSSLILRIQSEGDILPPDKLGDRRRGNLEIRPYRSAAFRFLCLKRSDSNGAKQRCATRLGSWFALIAANSACWRVPKLVGDPPVFQIRRILLDPCIVRLGVIEIISKGKAGLNSKKAAEFRYLLAEAENVAAKAAGFDL